MNKSERIAKLRAAIDDAIDDLLELSDHDLSDEERDYFSDCRLNVYRARDWAIMLERESA